MDNPLIYIYKHRINDCRSDISDCNSKIKKTTDYYDSLVIFKSKVVSHEESFNSIENSKNQKLKDLESLRKNCKTADEYYKGMNDLTVNLGTNKVGKVHSKMLEHIKNKLEEYKTEIEKNNQKITKLEKKIDWYETEIEKLK